MAIRPPRAPVRLLNAQHLRAGDVAQELSVGESLGWLNATVGGLWPRVDAAVQRIVHEQVTDQIQEKMPEPFKSIHFPEFTLGTVAPQLGPVKVFEVDNGLKLTLGVAYESDVDIRLKVGPVSVGIRELRFSGEVVVRLEQLLDQLPVVGGIIVHFLDPPKVDFELTGLTGIPGLRGLLRQALDRALNDSLVLPNQIAIPLGNEAQGVDRAELMLAKPVGLLRVLPAFVGELRSPDWDGAGKDTADAYVVVKSADQIWESAVVEGTCDPEWDQDSFGDMFVYDLEQRVWASVCDNDHAFETSDFIGATRDLTIREALMHEGPLTLHPTVHSATTDDAEADSRGKLTMAFQLNEFVTNELCGDRYALCVRVDGISLPARLGGRARLSATLSNGQAKATSLGRELVRHEGSLAVSDLLRDVARRADAKGLDAADIAEITAVSEEDVAAVLGGGEVEEQAVLARTRRVVRVDECMFFSFPAHELAGEDGNEGLTLELFVKGGKGEPLSSVSVQLATLADAEDLTVSELFSMRPSDIDECQEDAEMIEAKVSLSLMGTRQVQADDE